jgi:glutathione S-transferase
MLTLYSYPTLFGVADNNGYSLKVFAFLKLAGVPFRHEHIFDASKAPRSQLPYIVDGDHSVGDSETILAYVTQKYRLTIDAALTSAQRTKPSLEALAALIPRAFRLWHSVTVLLNGLRSI